MNLPHRLLPSLINSIICAAVAAITVAYFTRGPFCIRPQSAVHMLVYAYDAATQSEVWRIDDDVPMGVCLTMTLFSGHGPNGGIVVKCGAQLYPEPLLPGADVP